MRSLINASAKGDHSVDHYVLFGHAVTRSLSPRIHQLFAVQTKQSLHYEAQSLPIDGFSRALSAFFAAGGKGANVTAPFKQQAYSTVNQLTERAQVGAVNTVMRLSDGRLLGDNSDGIGLISDLQKQQMLYPGQQILLIGSGGAARGILPSLLAHHPHELVVVNRTVDKAMKLATQLSHYGPIRAAQPQQLLSSKPFDLIINSSSAPTFDVQYDWLLPLLQTHVACYDLNYQKQLTPFLYWAQQRGVARLSDGLGMLVEQAAHAFRLWRRVMPDVSAVLSSLRREWQCQ